MDAHRIGEVFLRRGDWRHNPFSVSGPLTWQGETLHCKRAAHDQTAEAVMLAAAQRLPTIAGVNVAPLVGYDAPRNVLVTRHVAGTMLFNAIWNGTDPWRPQAWRPRDWSQALCPVAQWLRELHQLPLPAAMQPSSRAERLEQLLDVIRERAERVKVQGYPGLSAAELDGFVALAERLATDADWTAQPMGVVHADLTLVNMLAAPAAGPITVLDFGYARYGFALEDLARLWVGVWEIAQCGRLRRRRLASALEAVPAAYGLSPRDLDGAPFRLLRLWNAMTRLHEAVVTRSRYRRATARIHRRLTTHHLAWLREQKA